MCFDWGERERERDIDAERNIQRSRSAVRPQLEWRATPVGARGPLSLPPSSFCLSLSVQLDVQEPLNPPPSLHLPDPGQFSPAMRGHLWEFIPDASCSLHPLLFLSLSSLSLSVTPPPQPHIYTSSFLLSVP